MVKYYISAVPKLPASLEHHEKTGKHITLAYLGELSASEVHRLSAHLGLIKFKPLNTAVKGFANWKAGASYYLVALVDEYPLRKLREDVCDKIAEAGLSYDDRFSFVPHITLRVKAEPFRQNEVPTIGHELPLNIDTLYLSHKENHLAVAESDHLA
jgi:2'-5' RNA ligase